jgi:hypothetical protein
MWSIIRRVTNFTEPDTALRYARTRWEDGEYRLGRAGKTPAQRDVLEHVVEGLLQELEKRVGQSFTTLQLAAVQETAEPWAQAIAHERAPGAPWAWDMDVVLDAACFRYSRRASDYQYDPEPEWTQREQ